MSFATTRTSLAAALTTALTGSGYTVYARRPVPFAQGAAWLMLTLADTEDITYGEVARATYNVLFCLGSDDIAAEIEMDRMAGTIITALTSIGVRGVTVSPLTLNIEGADIYCAVGTFITEVGV